MSDDTFFNDVNDALNGEQPQEESGLEKIEKIKLGENEYTQDELENLVGLGRTAKELEDKWSTKIDKLYPAYTKTTQELNELRKQVSSSEVKEIDKKAETGAELSPEELRAQAVSQARELGIVTKDDLNEYMETYYTNRRSAEMLIDDTQKIAREADDLGKPKVTSADLLEYMQTEGIRNPRTAYEIMFKDQLREWETKQLGSVKSGFVTSQQSSAGAKVPNPVKVTKDNLDDLVKESLFGQGGQS